MIDELVKQVSQRTGLPEETARTAVEVVLEFLKDRLPAPLGQQLEAALEGKVDLDDLAKGLGGLLGG